MDILQSKGYNIVSQVYQVTTCQVFKATHPGCAQCDGQIAIKVQRFNNQALLELSWREVQNMNSLQDLQHVVRLYEYFYEPLSDGTYALVLVMEWVEKDLMKDMQQRKSSNYPWPEQDLLALAADLIATLAEAERRGIAHRDIKPQNIFLDPISKTVKLGDFGSSKAGIVVFGPEDESVVGTPAFMSEELKKGMQNREQRIPHNVIKSDVYALGVTLFTIAKLDVPLWFMRPMTSAEELMHDVNALNYGNAIKTMIWDMINPKLQNRLTFVELEVNYCNRRAVFEQPSFQWESEPYSREPVAQRVEMGEKLVLPKPDESHADDLQVQSKSIPHPQSIFQNDFKEMVAPNSVLSCCDCGKRTGEITTPPVILPCPGCRGMMFCSRECVSNYVEKATLGYVKKKVICSHCSSPVNESEIVEAYGGNDKLKEKVREYAERGLLCVCCKSKRATHFIECGHIFCKPCLAVYKTPIFEKRTTICSVCRAVTTKMPKEITKRNQRWLSFDFCSKI